MRFACDSKFAALDRAIRAVRVVFDLCKMYGHTAASHIWEFLRMMNHQRHFLTTDFIRTITEHKQHGIDDIGFAAAIWPDDGMETLRPEKNEMNRKSRVE